MTSASLRRVLPECSTSFLVSEVDRLDDRMKAAEWTSSAWRTTIFDRSAPVAKCELRSTSSAADHAEMTDDAHQRRDR
jgi:hypothetical protein